MNTFKPELHSIELKLGSLSDQLVNGLNTIYESGVPAGAEKIVLWVPLGEQYGINFTYMTNDANEVGNVSNQLESLDPELDQLLDEYIEKYDCDEFNVISKLVDKIFAKWLRNGLELSRFKSVSLHKVMAINNACSYFDLATLGLLEDDEMWSYP